jgi:4-hydroxy-3-methylbut-2-en-1-yl diphosphate reductase
VGQRSRSGETAGFPRSPFPRPRAGGSPVKRVLLAAPRSFCAGVDRAIEIVERLLAEHGPPIYVRHQIVHNDNVVRRLEALGAVFVDSEDEVPPGQICVLSAHGVAPAVRANCEQRGLRVVDAVCPLVSKVHAEARRYADTGHLVALVGHAEHVEVIGTRGERPDATVVVESPEEALRLEPDGRPVAVISQTTLSLDDVRSTVQALEERFGSLKRPAADDICYATQNRQDAVKRLAQEATLILVIGSQTSSNAQRLVEVARNAGAEAELIDGETELDDAMVAHHEVIGLTAGASTPEELVERTIARLASRGYGEVEEVTVAREDVHFRLPREVSAR